MWVGVTVQITFMGGCTFLEYIYGWVWLFRRHFWVDVTVYSTFMWGCAFLEHIYEWVWLFGAFLWIGVTECNWVWVGVTGCQWVWLGVIECGWVCKMVKTLKYNVLLFRYWSIVWLLPLTKFTLAFSNLKFLAYVYVLRNKNLCMLNIFGTCRYARTRICGTLKGTLWEKCSAWKLKKILHFMTTFHNFACKIETSRTTRVV